MVDLHATHELRCACLIHQIIDHCLLEGFHVRSDLDHVVVPQRIAQLIHVLGPVEPLGHLLVGLQQHLFPENPCRRLDVGRGGKIGEAVGMSVVPEGTQHMAAEVPLAKPRHPPIGCSIDHPAGHKILATDGRLVVQRLSFGPLLPDVMHLSQCMIHFERPDLDATLDRFFRDMACVVLGQLDVGDDKGLETTLEHRPWAPKKNTALNIGHDLYEMFSQKSLGYRLTQRVLCFKRNTIVPTTRRRRFSPRTTTATTTRRRCFSLQMFPDPWPNTG